MNIVSYKVQVTVTTERIEKSGREWKPETAEANSKMAYTPEIERTVSREIEIFEQRVETLDMGALVAVVNNLKLAGN